MIRVIDMHAYCVIPVQDVVAGTPLAEMGSGGGNNILGPQRLAVMDEQGVDVQVLSVDGYWWHAADQDLARRLVRFARRCYPATIVEVVSTSAPDTTRRPRAHWSATAARSPSAECTSPEMNR